MKLRLKATSFGWLCALAVAGWCGAQAQSADAPPTDPVPPPSAPPRFSAAELQKLAEPIALHPDPLISLILPASVYPVEIVQAARFVKDTNNIPKVDEQSWDENVKAVAKFPSLIQKMNDDLEWTVDLGQAFLEQPKELMDAIQMLRTKANSAGVLQTTPEQIVVVTNTVTEKTVEQQLVYVTNTVVQIQPANPEVVYVPTYPPTVYAPPPGYVYNPVAPLVTFGVGIAVGAIIANNCDWHGGGVYVGHRGAVAWGGGYHGNANVNVSRNVNANVNRNVNANVNRNVNANVNQNVNANVNQNVNANVNQNANVNRNANAANPPAQKWQPDQTRLQGAGASGSMAGARTAEARGWSSGAPPPAPAAKPLPAAGQAPPSAAGGQPSAARPAATASPGQSRPSPTAQARGGSSGAAQPGSAAKPLPPTGRVPPSAGGGQPSGARPAATPSPSQPRPTPSASRPPPSASSQSAFGGVNNGAGARQSSNRGSASRGGGGRGR